MAFSDIYFMMALGAALLPSLILIQLFLIYFGLGILSFIMYYLIVMCSPLVSQQD